MRISQKLTDDEYDIQVTPVIIRLFSSPDRALRVCLLDNLPHMIDHLSQKLVTDKIFPQMVTGFGDLAPVVREQTVKAVLVVIPKLSDRVINGELLRHLAKTANDEQPGIRTNTTICLGKIARNLGVSSRAKVLSAAFSRSLRDPFVHARNAALLALAATADVFSEDDCATKMLPAICPGLVDKEKMIRDQANKTLNIYLERVRKYSTTLPDTVLPPPETSSASAPTTRMGTPQPGNQWMGWAISSFTNKLSAASGEIETTNTTAASAVPLERSTSSPAVANGTSAPARPFNATASTAPRASSGLRDAVSAPAVEEEDFGADWGAAEEDDDAVDMWAEPSEKPAKPSKPVVSYDDGGEPDFEGWLNAQAQGKTQSKKPLPKGLAKKTPVAASRAASAPVTKKTVPLPAKTTKVVETKPAPTQDDDDDDGWGDEWS